MRAPPLALATSLDLTSLSPVPLKQLHGASGSSDLSVEHQYRSSGSASTSGHQANGEEGQLLHQHRVAAHAAPAAVEVSHPGAQFGTPSFVNRPGGLPPDLRRPQPVHISGLQSSLFEAMDQRLDTRYQQLEDSLAQSAQQMMLRQQVDLEERMQAQFDARLQQMNKLYEDRLAAERALLDQERQHMRTEIQNMQAQMAEALASRSRQLALVPEASREGCLGSRFSKAEPGVGEVQVCAAVTGAHAIDCLPLSYAAGPCR